MQCQNVLAYKSCTVVKMFQGQNVVLWKELHENKTLLIQNLPHNYNLFENE